MTSYPRNAGPLLASTNAEAGKERWRAQLILMGELEASLEVSQNALLAFDLLKLESETQRQASWIEKFHALTLRPTALALPNEKSAAADEFLPPTQAEPECKRSHARILDALRLHAALLARMRAKLRVVGNILAGPTAPYRLYAGDRAPAQVNCEPRKEI